MSEKLKVGFVMSHEVKAMLERMSTDELRTLSGELELAIRERHKRLYGGRLVDPPAGYDVKNYDHG